MTTGVLPARLRRSSVLALASGLLIVGGVAAILTVAPRYLPQATVEISSQRDATSLAAGAEAPDFSLQDSAGRTVALSDFRGTPVVVVFWASWNPLALEQVRTLEQYLLAKPEKPPVVLAVNNLEDKETVKNYARRSATKQRVLLDQDGVVGERYRLTTLPAVFLVDRKGRIVERSNAPIPSRELEQKLTLLTEGSGVGGE